MSGTEGALIGQDWITRLTRWQPFLCQGERDPSQDTGVSQLKKGRRGAGHKPHQTYTLFSPSLSLQLPLTLLGLQITGTVPPDPFWSKAGCQCTPVQLHTAFQFQTLLPAVPVAKAFMVLRILGSFLHSLFWQRTSISISRIQRFGNISMLGDFSTGMSLQSVLFHLLSLAP